MSTFNCGRCCSCLSLDVFRCLRKMCMFTIPFACNWKCVHAHMHVHVCVCVSEHTCVLLLFHVHVSMCTYRYTCVCVCCAYAACMRIYMCMRARACVYVALYNQSLRTCRHAPIAYSSEAHVTTHVYTCGDALWEERAPAFTSKKQHQKDARPTVQWIAHSSIEVEGAPPILPWQSSRRHSS